LGLQAQCETQAGETAFPRGAVLLNDPVLNKGTPFTEDEQEILGLQGLLPPRGLSQDQQVRRVIENVRLKKKRSGEVRLPGLP
jgi:malate dehydrogenase (oxaloacetate-decarboxylating)(NADP+)